MCKPKNTIRAAFLVCQALILTSSASFGGFPPANPAYQTGFPVEVSGERITSPVALGDVDGDGILDIVVGGDDGIVYAYDGTGSLIWEFDTQGETISGKPAIADIDGDGSAEVVVGAGSTTATGTGGLWVISHTGVEQCKFVTEDIRGGGDGFPDEVFASPALADLDGDDGGRLEIVFGSWDKRIRAIHDDCTVLWERSQLPLPPDLADFFFDSIWSSAAIGDLNDDGQLDVVFGCDSFDNAPNVEPVGGALHAFDGLTGMPLPGFPKQIDEVIWSSPALADLSGNEFLDIAVGTGFCWENPACAVPPAGVQVVSEAIYAWDAAGVALTGWPFDLSTTGTGADGTYAFASPALADLDGDDQLDLVINTIDPDTNQGGQIYALSAAGGVLPGWPVQPVTPSGPGTTVTFSTKISPIVADITGDGEVEIILPSNWDLVVFDKDGNQLSRDAFPTPSGDYELRANGPFGGSAAVGDIDGDGDLEVVGAGVATLSPSSGGIFVWDFPAPASAPTPWPSFRRDALNQGRVGGEPTTIFIDGFESGDTSAWNSTAN